MLFNGLARIRCLSALIASGLFIPLATANDEPSEHDLRAALVFNVAKFIEWPVTRSSDLALDLCVYAENDAYRAFSRLTNRRVRSHALRVRWIDPRSIETTSCEILYVDDDMEGRPASLHALRRLPTLTIGETRLFAEQDGDMALVRRANRVRFVINHEAATLKGLKFRSQLLQVADVIQPVSTAEGRRP